MCKNVLYQSHQLPVLYDREVNFCVQRGLHLREKIPNPLFLVKDESTGLLKILRLLLDAGLARKYRNKVVDDSLFMRMFASYAIILIETQMIMV